MPRGQPACASSQRRRWAWRPLTGSSPGRYTLQVEFPGFETAVVRDVRIRTGDTRRTVLLHLAKLDEEVNVTRDKQTAALDPLGAAFSTVLTREQIDALPDDPDEMERVLKAMAPPGAVIRVDGFTGGKLPPKSQIRSIRLPRMDSMAAQNHGGLGGMMHIDIMTQPGLGPTRGSVDFAFRDDALNARNPFADDQGRRAAPALRRVDQRHDPAEQVVVLGDGPAGRAVRHRQPAGGAAGRHAGRAGAAADGVVALHRPVRPGDHARSHRAPQLPALERDPTQPGDRRLRSARARLRRRRAADNLFRVSENGPLGRRFFTESRLQVRWSGSENRSAIEAPTIRVLDAFTSGGAQVSGGTQRRRVRARQRSRLRARQALVAHRVPARGRAVPFRRHVELPRHVHLLEHGGLPGRPPGHLHAPHRRSRCPLLEPPGRPVRSGRFPRGEERGAQLRSAVRGADARFPIRTTSRRG